MLKLVVLAMIAFQSDEGSRPIPPEEVSRSTREGILEELQPVVLENCDLKRFGSANDGGYLLCDNLSDGIESAYSYSPNDPFGCAVAKRYGVPVHVYDCADPAPPACDGGVVVFHQECIGPEPDVADGQVWDALENHIYANEDAGKRLIVEIDVEGDEWEPLAAMPEEVLELIDQLALELHGVNDPRNLEILRRLKEHFFLVNVHFNNFTCTGGSAPLPAPVFQVLLVNRRLGVVDPTAPGPAPQSPLNAPDAAGHDCQLTPENE